jgi:8-oxo-dGTP diphosphatase
MNGGIYRYCPHCGFELLIQDAFQKMRPVCSNCGFVQFMDPKVAVIGMVIWQEQVLLVRRGINPARGLWALPGGYMDAGEIPVDALNRELYEEVGFKVDGLKLLDVFLMEGGGERIGIVLAYYNVMAADATPALQCGDDADEAGWFKRDMLPKELAFASTIQLLDLWQRDQIPK